MSAFKRKDTPKNWIVQTYGLYLPNKYDLFVQFGKKPYLCAENLCTMKWKTLLLAVLCASFVSAQDTVSLLFGGDAMGHSPQFQYAYNASTDSYDYEPNFRYIRPFVLRSDLSVVNLEVTLAGQPYSGYPNFSTPDSYLDAIRNTGFDLIMLANNHILDRGRRGMERTLDQLGDCPNMGAYRSPEDRAARYPVILEVQGLRIAFFNCTYGCNGYRALPPTSVNLIDTAEIARDLASVADKNIDLRVMTIHWGVEYLLKANQAQRDLAQWFVDKGFDLVIGGHPHVVEDAEMIGDVPVFYSLGNLVSNQRRENTNGGLLVRVDIDRTTAKIVSTSYLPCYVHKGILTTRQPDGSAVQERQYFIIPTTEYLADHYPFRLPAEDEAALKTFHFNTLQRIPNFPVMR